MDTIGIYLVFFFLCLISFALWLIGKFVETVADNLLRNNDRLRILQAKIIDQQQLIHNMDQTIRDLRETIARIV